jgi:hypothetical protein
MSFNNGDVVRIGKGKVEYSVSEVNADGTLNLTSAKSNRKNVDPATLTLVEAAPSVFDDQTPEREQFERDHIEEHFAAMDELDTDDVPPCTTEYPMAIWEVELLWSDKLNPERPFLLTVDHVTTDHKSYGAACDALIIAARDGFEHYAVIDQDGKRLATRTAA